MGGFCVFCGEGWEEGCSSSGHAGGFWPAPTTAPAHSEFMAATCILQGTLCLLLPYSMKGTKCYKMITSLQTALVLDKEQEEKR